MDIYVFIILAVCVAALYIEDSLELSRLHKETEKAEAELSRYK
jgi:hypothetical protein